MWHNKRKNYTHKINKTSTIVPFFMKLIVIIKKYHDGILFIQTQNVLDNIAIWCRMR